MKKIILIILLLGLVKTPHSQTVWNNQNSGTSNNLNKIYNFYTVSGNALFIAGDNGIILRSNNGNVWESINSNTTEDLHSIDIRYNDTGYAVGSNGIILKTVNGGLNWSKEEVNTNLNLRDVKLVYPGIVKAVAAGDNGFIFLLINNEWKKESISTENLNSIAYFQFTPILHHCCPKHF